MDKLGKKFISHRNGILCDELTFQASGGLTVSVVKLVLIDKDLHHKVALEIYRKISMKITYLFG